jgi:hypothetical protein
MRKTTRGAFSRGLPFMCVYPFVLIVGCITQTQPYTACLTNKNESICSNANKTKTQPHALRVRLPFCTYQPL